MQVANISQFRKNMKAYIDNVSDNNDMLVVNGNGKTVVVLSIKDYNSMNETEYLTSNEANKAMMYRAKDEIEKGKVVAISSADLENMIKND
ncbi:MAG: type II toxin-antitoxin system Phd/YefM family antitoxin [Chitinophagaceae bacterium]